MNPCPKIDKFLYFYHPSTFERDIIFKEYLSDRTYWNKLWNRLHWKIFWKKKKVEASGTIATASMKLFVALVSSFQLLTNFTINFT